MSIDYSKALVWRGNINQAFVANSTKVISGAGTSALGGVGTYIFGKGTLFKVLKIDIRINTAGASATQTFRVQKSDSAGSFSSATTVGSVTIASTDAAGALLSTTIAAADTDVDNSNGTNLYAIRLVHIATATDASLDYDYAVYYTPPHC